MLEKKSKLILLGILIFTVAGCSKEMQSINSLKDLEFSKIGIYTGSEYDSLLEQKLPNSEATYFNSYSDQISALKAGKIDGFLTDEPLSKEIIKNIPHVTFILDNPSFNKFTKMGYNMNKIKAILHNKVLVEMIKKEQGNYEKIVVDQFVYPKKYYEHINDAKVLLRHRLYLDILF